MGTAPTYRLVEAKTGTSLTIEIRGEAGGLWTLRREAKTWSIFAGTDPLATCRVLDALAIMA